MRKIPRTAKLDEAVGRVQFGSPRNFLNPIISKLDKHVVLYYLLIIEHPKTEKHGKYFTSLRFARHATGQTL